MPATQILVVGDQGSGKSSAWENMSPESTLVATPNAKPFPWRGSAKQYIVGKNRIQTKKLVDLPTVMRIVNDQKPEVTDLLIEDLNHFYNARTTSSEFLNRKLGNDAFAKWGEMGADVADILAVGESFRDDLNIIYHAHTEMHEDGVIRMMSPGKLLDREIKPASYFTYVFHAVALKTDKGMQYGFLTNKDGIYDAKTPKGCFKDLFVPNDMKQIIATIREYQGN